MDHPDLIVQTVCRADLKKMLVVLIFVKDVTCKNLAMLFHVDRFTLLNRPNVVLKKLCL